MIKKYSKVMAVSMVICIMIGIQSLQPFATGVVKQASPKLVKASVISANSIKISWKKVSGATGYVVYKATSKTGNYSSVKTTSAITFTDNFLYASKTYYFKVKAYKTIKGVKKFSNYSKMCYAKTKVMTVLRVGFEPGYPPMEMIDENGKYSGFDIDFARAIASKLKLKTEFVPTSWDGIFDSLKKNKFDCIISGMTILKIRQENYLMSQYITNTQVIIVQKGDTSIEKTTDLLDKGVGVIQSTSSDELGKSLNTKTPFKSFIKYAYNNIDGMFKDLKDNNLDAIIIDRVVAGRRIADNSENYKFSGINFGAEPYGICLRKNESSLYKKINDIIAGMKNDGSLAQISIKWFGEDLCK